MKRVFRCSAILAMMAFGTAWAQGHRRGKSTLIGAPPPAIAIELDRLWRAE